MFEFKVVRRRSQKRKILKVSKKFEKEKEKTRVFVHARLAYFNHHYNFVYNKVFIRNQRSRWGSCSSKGNLNFTYKLGLLAPELADYIIVHELCHIGQFNHSVRFWSLVAETIPEYKELRIRLKEVSLCR